MKKDLKFAILISNKKIPHKIQEEIKRAYKKNKKIFNKSLNKKFKIFICHTKKEWKKQSKYYYFPFGAGTVLRNGNLIIKSQKYLNTNNKNYQILIEHEMNHVFFALIYGVTKPVWIHEGLANFIAGYLLTKKQTLKYIKQKSINHEILQYRYQQKNFQNKTIRLNYSIWKYFIEYLSKNNPDIIIKFMNEFIKNPTKNNYNKLFLKHFKKNPKQKFNDFLKWMDNF
jgi:hypothetical protein